jgi:hypothetical protein
MPPSQQSFLQLQMESEEETLLFPRRPQLALTLQFVDVHVNTTNDTKNALVALTWNRAQN